ncbi:MAG: argininosuccinate lyase [Dehalococcoidia bacterium]|nr:argininosuccinate lyase [Dehalococcoidia bacterium]
MTLRERFQGPPARKALEYTASIPFDRRLALYDIKGSIAHARMLARQGIISDKDAELIVMGLSRIREEIERGAFEFKLELEDIHLNIEARLTERIGEAGGRLHTARSRNDQVATDLRLYAKDASDDTVALLKALQNALLDQAQRHLEAPMPGYTHLQRAQPVLLAHHLLAYVEMLQRDRERFQQARARADVLPLGSGALAGVAYPVDRDFLARELGFSRISRNSLDAVSDRDFVVDYLAAAALAMVHLSRLAEEVVLWCSAEFGFVELDDAYATGSSIMPQKKNPDVAELARGKTGRVLGHLTGTLAMLKGLPLAYNKDLQEDKEALFDSVDTLLATLDTMAGMVGSLRFRPDRTAAAAGEGAILATDLADYLVRKGVPFRDAHGLVARLVKESLAQGRSISELGLADFRAISPHFGEDVLQVNVASSLAARDVPGGTAPRRVREALAEARRLVDAPAL